MTKPLLIGQAPGPNTDPNFPLFPLPKTSAGGRLAEYMGLSKTKYLSIFNRINLLYRFNGQWSNGDKFSIRDARVAASSLQQLFAGRQVILIGRQVANAFNVKEDFFVWSMNEVFCYEVVVVPHTSGRNHWYNIKDNRNKAVEFWRDYFVQREILDSINNGL